MSILQSLGALPMFILMFVILYFVLIRPQIKEQKDKENMIANLKKGDRIVTRGGLLGKIIDFQGKNNEIATIDNNGGSKIKVLRQYLTLIDENK